GGRLVARAGVERGGGGGPAQEQHRRGQGGEAPPAGRLQRGHDERGGVLARPFARHPPDGHPIRGEGLLVGGVVLLLGGSRSGGGLHLPGEAGGGRLLVQRAGEHVLLGLVALGGDAVRVEPVEVGGGVLPRALHPQRGDELLHRGAEGGGVR